MVDDVSKREDGKNRYLGAYDKPVLKDWIFWLHVGVTVLCCVALAFPTPETAKTSTTPLWIDIVIGGPLVGFIFVYPIALVRRLVRSVIEKRAREAEKRRSVAQSSYLPPLYPAATWPPPMTNQSPRAFWDQPVPLPQPIPNASEYQQPPAWPTEPAPATPPTVVPTASTERQVPVAAPVQTPGEGAPPQQPVEITDITRNTSDDVVLDNARTRLPYPIARTVRAYQINGDPFQSYELLLELGETVSVCVGALSAAWLRAHQPSNPAMVVFLDRMHGGISQGAWHELISAASNAMRDNENAIPNFVTGVSRSKKTRDLVEILREIVTERNRWAHGARPTTKGEALARAATLKPAIDEMVRKISFLGQHRWLLIRNAAYVPRQTHFVVDYGAAMGDHPDFEVHRLTSTTPVATENFYVHFGNEFMDLSPFIVYRYCSHCHSPEVFFADRIRDSGAVLKSFARGHEEFDQALFDEFEALKGA